MKTKIGLLVLVVFVSLFSLSACGLVSDMSAVKDTGDAFMTALRDGDHQSSWNMLDESVQAEIGDQAAWVDFASIRNFEEWVFTNTSVENDYGQLDGEATLGNETYTTQFILYKVGDEWKIAGITFEFLK